MLKVLDGVIQRNAITEVTSCLPLSQKEELRRLWATRTCVLPFPSAELQNGSSWIPWLPPAIGDLLFLVPCTLVFSLQASFLLHTVINFGDPHPVSANSDSPPGCGNAVMLLLTMVKSAGKSLWCSRSGLRSCCGVQVSSWKGVCKEEGFKVFPKRIQIQTFKSRHPFHLLRRQ